MLRINLENSLTLHHRRPARVSECLELGDLFHGCRPAELARHDNARRARQAVGHSHGRNVVYLLLPPVTQTFEVGRCLFAGLVNVREAVLRNVGERLALILCHVAGDVLVQRVVEEDDLEPLGVQHLDERRTLQLVDPVRPHQIVDARLVLLHPRNVLVQRGGVPIRLCRE